MDLIDQLAELALGSRLKRLSETIMNSGVEVYETLGIDFNPRWFPLYYALSEQDEQTVTQLAQSLDLSHPGLIKMAKGLEKRGLIESIKDPLDKRKRILRLTEEGKDLLPNMQDAWTDISGALRKVVEESEGLLSALEATEDALKKRPLPGRVKRYRSQRLMDQVEILDYSPDIGHHFKRINYAWIEKYFKVEPIDIEYLDKHQEKILEPGGVILFASFEGQIIGTVALIKKSYDEYELAKMGVDEGFQGRQIGKKLGLAAIERAKRLRTRRLFLESNRKLEPALQLYRRLGFREVFRNQTESDYARSNIIMEMYL